MRTPVRLFPLLALAPAAAFAAPRSTAYELGYAAGQQFGQLMRIALPLGLAAGVAVAVWLGWRAWSRRRAAHASQ
ncbi:hypothetical protein CMZ84_02385 [Lysobacteraceae bacterium NML93-0399]|nr:hypothetical protein CMZ84_02385 [Xanthomonadaceae bacterium NML93-0399]